MKSFKEIICSKCKNPVPIRDIKYVQDKKESPRILCSSCREEKKENVSRVLKKQSENPKKSYHCLRCTYDFKVNPSKADINCPYCGKSDRIKENKIVPIDAILKDS